MMGKIKVTPCETEGKVIEGLYVIEPTVFRDERGYFMETYNQNDFKEAGLNMVFVQDNQSMSVKGVLRGLHFQRNSSIFRRGLPTAFWYCLMRRNSPINVRISTIPAMRADSFGAIRISA